MHSEMERTQKNTAAPDLLAGGFVALRKRGRREGVGRAVFHAVTPHCRIALCGDEPGARSAWAEPPATAVTCPVCLARLSRIQ
jgi:hypothetical protein